MAPSVLLDHEDIPLPLRVVAAKRGVGSFLTIDLVDEGNEAWRLWVYLCDWQIAENGVELLDSECPDDADYERVLSTLIGRDLERSSIDDDLEAFTLSFSGELELFVSDANDLYGDGQHLMMIFRNRTFVVAFRGGRGLDASPDGAQ